MIPVPARTRVWLKAGVTDMRKVSVTPAQLAMLLEGIEMTLTRPLRAGGRHGGPGGR